MQKLMKIPFYVPFLGVLASFALIIAAAYVPSTAMLIAGMVLLHLAGWIAAAKFFLSGIGFLSSVVDR
jgi:hypothetical protein